MDDEITFERAATRYKVETADKRELEIYLNATRFMYALYDILCWRRAIYNGKNYGEGYNLYRGTLYDEHDWMNLKHEEDEYKEGTPYLKDKVTRVYTEDELLRKLDDLLDEVAPTVWKYTE